MWILQSMVSMMDQGPTSMKASAPTTAGYGVKCKGLWQDKVIQ